jgi:hypothetical protein
MRFSFLIILMFIGFGATAQVYQNMAQPGYKFGRARFDSVLTIPTGLGAMRNITGGQDTGQIRFNVSDSSVYVWNGRRWVRPVGGTDTTSLSNRINAKLNISDTAAMLSPYVRAASLTIPTLTQVLEAAPNSNEAGANQIKDLSAGTSQNDAATFGQLTDTANLRLRISDTSAMLRRYLDTLQAHNTRIISAGGGGGSTGWALTGNASAVTDFLGTTNDRSLRVRTNNVERFVVDSIGNIKIGTISVATPTASPTKITLDNTYGTTAGSTNNLKFIISNAGYGLGLQTNSMEYHVPVSNTHAWYVNSLEAMRVNATRTVSIGTSLKTAAQLNIGLNTGAASSKPDIRFWGTLNGFDGNLYNAGIIYGTFDAAQNSSARITFGSPTGEGTFTDVMSIKNGAVGIGITTPVASAALDMVSTTRGLLIPRMTLTQRNAIASPAAGLQVIVTGETGGEFLSFYNSSTAAWQRVVKLTSAGRLLLGTTTESTHILDVVGTARVSGQMSINGYTVSSPGTGSIKIGINPNTTGSGVTAVGEGAITTNSYSNSSAFGLGSLGLGGGNRVSAFGWYAGYSNNGSFNTYVGAQSGWNQTTGANNVFLGDRAGDKISGGSTNLTIANNSILIGQNTKALADNQTNQIVIGYDETGLGSNTTIIGNSSTVTTAIRGRVLIGTTTVDASAALNITSTTQGVLFPRMTTTQKLAIGSPAAGLQVYDTTLNQMSYFNGTTWVNF